MTNRKTKTAQPSELTDPLYWLSDTDATQRECVAMIPYLEDIESRHSIIALAHAWANANAAGCHTLKISLPGHPRYIIHTNADDPENIHKVAAMSRTVYIKKETTNDR